MNLNMVTSVKNLSSAVTGLNKELGNTARLIKTISGYSGKIKTLSASVKSLNNLGNAGKIFDDSASFSDTTQGGTGGVKGGQASSAAQREQSSTTRMPFTQSRMGSGLIAGTQAALAVGGAFYAGMPDTGAVVGRAAGFYGAAVMGGINQGRLRQAVFSGLAGGVTGVGDDAAAAAALIQGYRYAPTSAAFSMRVREIGGAARMLNISNPVAAEALGAMGSGQMAGNLSQYGIFTSDPRTGKDLPFEEIAKQIYGRAYGGRKVSREQVMTDVRSGFLGADLRRMGFDATQQELFVNAFGNFAEGKGFNLGGAQGAGNPLAAQMRINTSQTSLMERATDPMIKGFNDAATVVEKFNKSMEGLPDLMFQFKSTLQVLAGTNVGGAAGTLVGGLGMAANTLTGAAAFRYMMGAGKAGGAATTAAAGAGKVASRVVPGLGAVVSGASGYYDAKTGGGLNTAGLLTSIGAGALTGGLIGNVPGAIIGGVLGGVSYGAGYLFGSGGGTSGFGASFGAKGGGNAQSPAPGVTPTTGFGAKDASGIWKGTNNTHTGQDYPMPIGSDVQAALDGVVFDDAPGYEYGITVQIDHENGFQTLYGHLSKALVKPGDRVKKGQVIGKSGDTGNVTGPHLHFEVRKGSNNPVDPQQLLDSPFASAGLLTEYSPDNKPITDTSNYVSSLNSSVGVSPSAGKKGWIKSFLSSIGAPATKDNIYAMSEWIRFESGNKWGRWNNPLNTTLNVPGAKSMNSVGVKKYGSASEGLQATIATLTGKRADQRGYTDILNSLRSGADYKDTFDAIRASAWVGGEDKKSPYKFNYNRGPSGGGRTGFGASVASAQPTTMAGNRTVNVTLNIQQASEEEAIRFAKRIKHYLDSDNDLQMMGSK